MNKNEKENKKKKSGKIFAVVLTICMVVAISVVGLSACNHEEAPEEEPEEASETVKPESDKDSADKDKKPAKDDTDKDSTAKDKKPAKPSEKPDKETDKKPEKTPAPDVKPDKPSKPTPAPDVKPDKPSKPTTPPAPKPTTPPAPKPTNPPAHVHTWEDVTEVRTTGYNEEQVLVEEAYDEEIVIGHHNVCNGCGMSLSGMDGMALAEHVASCGPGSYHSEPIKQTIHHDAVYETVKTPITETVVVGRRCTSCGTYEAY